MADTELDSLSLLLVEGVDEKEGVEVKEEEPDELSLALWVAEEEEVSLKEGETLSLTLALEESVSEALEEGDLDMLSLVLAEGVAEYEGVALTEG